MFAKHNSFLKNIFITDLTEMREEEREHQGLFSSALQTFSHCWCQLVTAGSYYGTAKPSLAGEH